MSFKLSLHRYSTSELFQDYFTKSYIFDLNNLLLFGKTSKQMQRFYWFFNTNFRHFLDLVIYSP